MAVYAKPVLFLAVPHTSPLAVQAGFPLAKYGAVALAAQVVRFIKTDQFAVRKPQFVPVIRIVAVETPAAGHVLQRDVLMELQLSRVLVYGHALMALRARKDTGTERRRWNEELFRDVLFLGLDT